MKHLLKFPQQKTNHSVSYLETPLRLELNDIKVINVLNHILECYIPIKINERSINKIKEIDELSLNTLNDNPDWINKDEQDLDTLYYTSYFSDISHMYLFINNKTNCSFNCNDKDVTEILSILKNNKSKDYNITVDITFFGLFIQSNKIGNKWLIKNISVDEVFDNKTDWNKEEIEEDWEEEVQNYEIEMNEKIKTYLTNINEAKILLEEIKKEQNINTWEKKILKLKKYILKL
jgi:hypothetical protein